MLNQSRSEKDHKNVLEQGFTLVELLIVIVILGILAGIVVFAVGNLTSSSQNNACGTEMKTFETAVNSYNALRVQPNSGLAALSGTFATDVTTLQTQNLLSSSSTLKYANAGSGPKWTPTWVAANSTYTVAGANGCTS